jgi:hypothetical protein
MHFSYLLPLSFPVLGKSDRSSPYLLRCLGSGGLNFALLFIFSGDWSEIGGL